MSDIKSKNIELVDIDSIVQNPKNANKHPKEQIERLEKLIKYQGFRNPLIISNRTGFLVVGHGRLEAAKNLGMKQVPVIKQDFENEAQEYAYLISDNEIARWASLDNDLVYEELKHIELDDIELLGIENFNLLEGVNAADENAEWSEMEEFEAGDEYITLSIQFKTELAREVFCKDNHINVTTKGKKTWSAKV